MGKEAKRFIIRDKVGRLVVGLCKVDCQDEVNYRFSPRLVTRGPQAVCELVTHVFAFHAQRENGHAHTHIHLRRSHDDMNTTLRAHDIADLSYLQCKCSFLERLLHLTTSKHAKVATLVVRGTIRMHLCQLAKRLRLVRRVVDLGLMLSQDGDRFVLGPSNRRLPNENASRL